MRDRLRSSNAEAIDAAEGGPAHNARGAAYPRCIIWPVVFVGDCAVSVKGYKITARVACCVSLRLPLFQEGCVCVRVVTTDHSNTRTRLQ